MSVEILATLMLVAFFVLLIAGIPVGLTAIESLLRRSGAGGQPAPKGMRLPVALRNGSVYVGPIRTPVRLIPLY